MKKEFRVLKGEEGQRVDVFLGEKSGFSRSQIKKIADSIEVNGNLAKLSLKIKEGDVISFVVCEEVTTGDIEPENIALDILYEDKHIIVVNKEAGVTVHPGGGVYKGTLVNALLYHAKDMRFFGDKSRAGIVHRLDKDTAGIIITAKSPKDVASIQEQFKDRSVEKIYHAIALGKMKEDFGKIEVPIGRHPKYRKKMCVREDGKPAYTKYKVLKRLSEGNLLEITILTGRTHQIRVHLSYIKHPVAGDEIYSKSASKYRGLMLVAKKISFNHPKTGEKLSFEANYPPHFEEFLRQNS